MTIHHRTQAEEIRTKGLSKQNSMILSFLSSSAVIF